MFDLNNNIKEYNDFYNHVNSNWIKNAVIPSDNMLLNTFNELNEKNLNKIRKIINKMDKSDLSNSYEKVIILYNMSYNMKEDNRDIISDYIFIILNSNSIEELRKNILDLFTLNGISSPSNYYIYNDFNDSSKCILHIDTSGLGLPDRDYYIDITKKDTLKEYKIFMQKYLNYFNLDWDIDKILSVEKILAEYTYTNTMKRDVIKHNNTFTLEEIKILIPYLYEDLVYFLKKINYKNNINNIKININNPNFTLNFYKLLYTCDFNTIKQYFVYLFLRKIGNYIDINSINLLFDFYGKTLSGVKKNKKPWKRAVDTVNDCVGMLVGKMFVNEYFDSKAKEKVIYMIKFIKEELKKRLENNWMEPSTKKKAIEKLQNMNFKVGYPDEWIDYTPLEISKNNSLLQNILNCYKFDLDQDILLLTNGIDKKRWFMNPQEINAYYTPSYNEMVFPCGILQKPFFSLDMDMACNFGGIGCIIGHEITHGFDDMGSKYDMNGNLNNWWTEKDSKYYKNKSNLFKNMFDKLELYGNKVNGELTLGENIADLGGVEIAFNSLVDYYYNHKDELTNDSYKRFFYSYANIWKCVITKEEVIKRLTTDPHSPHRFRVNAILNNVNAFYNTFDIPKNSPMWLEENERFSIW